MEKNLISDLKAAGDPQKAKVYAWFFKTGKGEYAEGDRFFGVVVPKTRAIAAKYPDLSLDRLDVLLTNPFHEARFAALVILTQQFARADGPDRKRIFDFYLAHTSKINNWDLVDVSSHKIVGQYLLDKDMKILHRLAKSNLLWERRIAMIATAAFIAVNRLDETYAIADILLHDRHDLIHKAVGWMLREAGKRDQKRLEKYLEFHAHEMPRTMLRYALEKFPEAKRQKYLKSSTRRVE